MTASTGSILLLSRRRRLEPRQVERHLCGSASLREPFKLRSWDGLGCPPNRTSATPSNPAFPTAPCLCHLFPSCSLNLEHVSVRFNEERPQHRARSPDAGIEKSHSARSQKHVTFRDFRPRHLAPPPPLRYSAPVLRAGDARGGRRGGERRRRRVPSRALFALGESLSEIARSRDAAPAWGLRGGSATRPPDTTGRPETIDRKLIHGHCGASDPRRFRGAPQ